MARKPKATVTIETADAVWAFRVDRFDRLILPVTKTGAGFEIVGDACSGEVAVRHDPKYDERLMAGYCYGPREGLSSVML